jgi:hypothetical protein
VIGADDLAQILGIIVRRQRRRAHQIAEHVPAGLTVFRMGNDGKLTFAHKYDIVGDRTMFWMGMVPL